MTVLKLRREREAWRAHRKPWLGCQGGTGTGTGTGTDKPLAEPRLAINCTRSERLKTLYEDKNSELIRFET